MQHLQECLYAKPSLCVCMYPHHSDCSMAKSDSSIQLCCHQGYFGAYSEKEIWRHVQLFPWGFRHHTIPQIDPKQRTSFPVVDTILASIIQSALLVSA